LSRFFWRNFFSLLLVFVAAAQWACFAWLTWALIGVRFPGYMHVLGPVGAYALNRLVVSFPPYTAFGRGFRRTYTAVAFASLFGSVVLLLVGVLWGVARAGLEIVDVATGAAMPTAALGDLARTAATGGIIVVSSAIAYGYGLGQRKLWVNTFDVAVPGLDARLDGLRIAQISDVHLGPYMEPERIARYVARVNALGADVVVITGDITDGLTHAPETFPELAKLRAPLGVFAILGNHDFYTGPDEVTAALGHYTSFRVLRDEATYVERDGARLYVIGLDDRGMDWARGVLHCDELDELHAALPPAAPTLLLTHRPDIFGHAVRLGIALVLAGHTHGGQLAVPLRRGQAATLAHFMTRFPRGTYREGASVLHVNLGLGVTGQPVRIASPREITVVRLRTAPPRGAGTAPA
jgi:predicted MPP superfamily phosphohydrolase